MSGFIMPGGGAPTGTSASADTDLIKDTTTETFMADVIEESRHVPVLVDFWAPWCGPCKQLTPLLEKAVTAAKGRVKLVKMNIDDHPQVAGQLGVQSIPAVFAFKDGQPVDAFQGAIPESQIAAFIDQLAGPAGADPLEAYLEQAEELFENGALPEAAQVFGTVLKADPQNAAAIGGLVRCLVKANDLERARQTLGIVPPDKENDPAIVAARSALELAEQAEKLGDPVALSGRVDANPDDHEARFNLALILNAKGESAAALDALLEIIRRDRSWDDEAARKQLLKFFEAWGPTSSVTKDGRRRLSALLFS
ncbi:MAG: thioredoxin [Pseudomonadota bacterium]